MVVLRPYLALKLLALSLGRVVSATRVNDMLRERDIDRSLGFSEKDSAMYVRIDVCQRSHFRACNVIVVLSGINGVYVGKL